MWSGAGQKRRTLVDLIEGIGADNQRTLLTIDYSLGESEQRFAGAVDWQYMPCRIDGSLGYAKAPLAPAGNRFA